MSPSSLSELEYQVSLMYGLKLLRWMTVWISAYYARMVFFEKFVTQTVAARKRPPKLQGMVLVFFAIQLATEAVLLLLLAMIRVLQLDHQMLNSTFRNGYIVDTVASLATLALVLFVTSKTLGNDSNFDYTNEGTRGIRVFEELIVTLAGITFLIPYFLVFAP